MSQCLTIKCQSLAAFHGVVDVEVLHTHDFLVDVELTQVPIHMKTNPK